MSDSPDNAGKPQEPPKEGTPLQGGGSSGVPWVYSGVPEIYSAAPRPAAPAAQGNASPPAPAASPAPPTAPAPRPAAPVIAAPSAAGKASAPADKKHHGDASLASIVDTIEAIIIALIIALTFRAFVVEAFVIPTGSMAPTLLGAHFKAICPKCGYEFDFNATVGNQVQRQDGVAYVPEKPLSGAELRSNSEVPLVPKQHDIIYCPNCRYQIDPTELPQYLRAQEYREGPNGPWTSFHFPWANNGDRILVLKYLYAVKDPDRWDVIVFKEPQAADSNYIKRLVGLPRETVQIINGDIYAGTGESAWMNAAERKIQRKPEEIQKALWQLVYDNDYYPADEGKTVIGSPLAMPHYQEAWMNPWEAQPPEAALDWKKGTTMQYTGVGPGTLQFNLVPSKLPDYPPYTLNTLGYNGDFFIDDTGIEAPTPRSIVGDLRLEVLWTPGQGAPGKSAAITLTLGRQNNCYQFVWDDTGMKLQRRGAQGAVAPVSATLLGSPGAPVRGRPYRLAFNNVDHAVQIYLDDKKVLTYQEEWNAELAKSDHDAHPADWAHSRGNPLDAQKFRQHVNSIIRIDVDGACAISHLKLFRDLYYTQVVGQQGTGNIDNPVRLKENEFFALGDNSRKSLDGRMWYRTDEPLGDLELQVGVVPRRYLLGKAFFVYWPAGYRSSDKVRILKDLPLVPNTGNMRIIR